MLKKDFKSIECGEGKQENLDSFFRMRLGLYDYQAKASRYRKGLTYLKNRAPTNSQRLKTKVLKHKINGNHPTKRRKEKHKIYCKTRFKMAKINIYQ